MSAGNIDFLCLLWAASMAKHKDSPPFGGHRPLYEAVDAIPLGDVTWESVTLNYKDKDTLPDDAPSWQKADYDVWYRDPRLIIQNMLANPDFKDEFDYMPVRDFLPDKDGGGLHHKNFMSGNWAWKQAVSFTTSHMHALYSPRFLSTRTRLPRIPRHTDRCLSPLY